MTWSTRLSTAASVCLTGWLVAGLSPVMLAGGQSASDHDATPQASATSALPAPMNWTAEQDHQNMMDQLGIKALRPGPSGNEAAPNHANYDEATANPFPDLPDPLTLKNGRKVTTPAMWWNERRPEIVEDFEREVLGRVPANVPKMTWTVEKTVESKVGAYAVVGKQLVGHVDNTAYPLIDVDIQMQLVTPANAKGPVPVMMMFGGRGLPEFAPPRARVDSVDRELAALARSRDEA